MYTWYKKWLCQNYGDVWWWYFPLRCKKICFSKAQIHLREVRSRSKLPVCNHSTLYSVVYIYYSCIESAGTMHDNLCQETKNKKASPHISHFRGINWENRSVYYKNWHWYDSAFSLKKESALDIIVEIFPFSYFVRGNFCRLRGGYGLD